jgi:aryl-alcohol dehydrogenase-like predicted oxidoreductase
MALAPWNVLAGGKLRSDEDEERRVQSGDVGRAIPGYEWRRNEKERTMTTALAKVAKEIGAKHVTAVAIAYVMQKVPYVFPIIGARKVEQLEANVEALEIVLSPKHFKYLESIVPFELGFPFGLIVSFTRFLFRQPCLNHFVSYRAMEVNTTS